jgi:alpha-N-acetylglucosaminidase
LFGYAQRQYGGLMADYNLGSWKLYLDAAGKALREGKKFSGNGGVRAYTEKWIHERQEYPVRGEGDTLAIARMIWDKYAAKAPAAGAPVGPLKINDHE